MDLSGGRVLWEPGARAQTCRMAQYMRWLERDRGLSFGDYDSLWEWSVADLPAFWASIWDYFDIKGATPYTAVLSDESMPGAKWFQGATLNYADQVFRHVDEGDSNRRAIAFASENAGLKELSWNELRQQTASLAQSLRDLGVKPGDRVVAIMPNIPETIVTFLATASVGAIWSLCSPDMGPLAIVDRFRQIAPKVLVAVDGYRYGGKAFDRTDVTRSILAELPSVENVIVLPRILDKIETDAFPRALDWRDLTKTPSQLRTEAVPFDHPLWVVYSSGTTGLPKPIVHGHGGILVEALMMQSLHGDIGPGDTVLWYTSSGWIMWNSQVSALASGASIALYDGAPSYPDLGVLWRLIEDARVTKFGSGAAYYQNCTKANLRPKEIADLSSLTSLSSTGSPLSPEAYEWIYANVRGDVWLAPISGGTDFAGAFVCGVPMLPVRAGEMQCRALGHKVEAWNDAGQPVIEEVGELVCTKPVPSMPLYFWGDEGNKRYRESYFDMFPGVWRHGDWIKITRHGGAIIYGRSDATVNRYGIRMGTSEFYRVAEEFNEIADSLVADLEFLGRDSFLYLFVKLRDGAVLDKALEDALVARIRTALSPRHVPNAIIAAPEIPYTLSGKKLEVPVKKLLLGQPPEKVANRDVMANPDSLDWYIELAKARGAHAHAAF
jgi:acetoacetyl-CoA synthetase